MKRRRMSRNQSSIQRGAASAPIEGPAVILAWSVTVRRSRITVIATVSPCLAGASADSTSPAESMAAPRTSTMTSPTCRPAASADDFGSTRPTSTPRSPAPKCLRSSGVILAGPSPCVRSDEAA
jgi:hypothetical protein